MLNTAYSDAIKFTKSHYENFPVISFFIPKKLKKHIAVVYQFARQADDIADEGNIADAERLTQLNKYRNRLRDALLNKYYCPFWNALYSTIVEKRLTSEYFFNLLDAFEQDITKKRYENFEELNGYCSKSANPVGRIILELFGVFDEKANEYSDAICTALQLTNFYQDTKIDFQEKERIYLPQDELQKFNVKEKYFELGKSNIQLKKLIKFNIERVRKLFNKGKNLFPKLPGSLKRQIIITVNGGEAILNKIERNDFDVLKERPTLSKIDYFRIVLKSFRYSD